MKNKLFEIAVIALAIIFVLPTSVYGAHKKIAETDLSISIDEEYWYVFTRDNLLNNPELWEVGITYNDIKTEFYEKNLYLYAISYYIDADRYIEIYVEKENYDSKTNLSDINNGKVKDFAEDISKGIDGSTPSTLLNKYKYAVVDYVLNGATARSYVTIVNGDTYTITFQAPSEFLEDELAEIDEIVDSVTFDVKPSPEKSARIIKKVVRLAFILVASIVGTIVGKNKAKKKAEAKEVDRQNF